MRPVLRVAMTVRSWVAAPCFRRFYGGFFLAKYGRLYGFLVFLAQMQRALAHNGYKGGFCRDLLRQWRISQCL